MMMALLMSTWPLLAALAICAALFLAVHPPAPPVVFRVATWFCAGCVALSLQGAAVGSGLDLWVVAALVSLLAGAASASIFAPGSSAKEKVGRFFGSLLVGGIASASVITKYAMPHTEWIWVCGGGGFFGWGLGVFGNFISTKIANSKSFEAVKGIFLPQSKEEK